ncbi:MAG: Fic family protein [Chitinophagales bacterium]
MEINRILQQIDSLKKESDKLKPAKPESDQTFWNKFRLEFDYNSNHLEGNTLTYGHTQLLLLFDKIGSDDYSLRELEEMKAHDAALKIVKEESQDEEHQLTEKFIKEINEIILVRPFYKEAITSDGQTTRRLIEPGQYKKYPNSVRLENGEIFNYATPEETPALMGDLLEWYRKGESKKELHTLQLAALFHYRFVRIHPFDDSNGRTARLIMNYILMKTGFAPLVIESTNKKNYLTALNKADIGDIEFFVEYISGIALYWQELYLKALKGEKIEELEDFDKEVELLKRNLAQNKEPNTQISKDAVKNAFQNSLISLLKLIEIRLNKLGELFLKTDINFIGSIRGTNKSLITENLNTIETILDNFIEDLSSGGTLTVNFGHHGFKKAGTNVFDQYLSLLITFASYTYKVQAVNERELNLEKLYGDYLNQQEIDDFSFRFAKLELEQIKRISQKK